MLYTNDTTSTCTLKKHTCTASSLNLGPPYFSSQPLLGFRDTHYELHIKFSVAYLSRIHVERLCIHHIVHFSRICNFPRSVSNIQFSKLLFSHIIQSFLLTLFSTSWIDTPLETAKRATNLMKSSDIWLKQYVDIAEKKTQKKILPI